jgi:hypothetical protein
MGLLTGGSADVFAEPDEMMKTVGGSTAGAA